MFQFIQPAITLAVGLAMFAYGLIQSLLHRPSSSTFSTAVAALPDAMAVLIFILGLAAIVTGVILLVTGIRGIRGRAREINRTYGSPRRRRPPHDRDERDDYEEDWDGVAYR